MLLTHLNFHFFCRFILLRFIVFFNRFYLFYLCIFFIFLSFICNIGFRLLFLLTRYAFVFSFSIYHFIVFTCHFVLFTIDLSALYFKVIRKDSFF